MSGFFDNTAASFPPVGSYGPGAFVYNRGGQFELGLPGAQYVIIGWVRITPASSSNVLDADWRQVRMWVVPGAVTYIPVYNPDTGSGGGGTTTPPSGGGNGSDGGTSGGGSSNGNPHRPTGGNWRMLDWFNIPDSGYGGR